MLDVRLLLQFAAVAETLSFTEAARRLGMAQPRLSLQIRKLEEQLGVVLFTRSTRQVALTSHGRELFQLVRPFARLAGATLEEIERQRLGQGGRLRIGTVPLGEPSMVLASVLGQFSTANQEIEVEAEPGSIDGHYDRLLAGELDLAAITDFGAFKDLEAVRLQQLSFAAMFSDCDPLASRDALVPGDLAGRQVAMVPRRLAPDFFDTFYQPLIEAGAAPGFAPARSSGTGGDNHRASPRGGGPPPWHLPSSDRRRERPVAVALPLAQPPAFTGIAEVLGFRTFAGERQAHGGEATRSDRCLRAAKIHATGDRALRIVLDAIEKVREVNGSGDPRHEIAHAGFISDAGIPRFAELKAVADLSPFIWSPSSIIESIKVALGERGERYYPIHALVEADAPLAAGSDWPSAVPSMNPWAGIEAMVTRQDPYENGGPALGPEQAVSLEQAIRIFTLAGASALRLEDRTGSITEGKSADFVVLDRNIFEVSIDEVSEARPAMTFFEGRLVYQGDNVTP